MPMWIGIIVFIFFILLLWSVFLGRSPSREGLANLEDVSLQLSGLADKSTSYAASLHQLFTKQSDTFLVKKYKKDYDKIVVDLHDVLNYLMLESVLSIKVPTDGTQIKPDDILTTIETLNKLKQGQESLNVVSTVIDTF
jgi:hypothetical protein